MTDMSTLLAARRADLGDTPPIANGEVEVIPPADAVTGEILPAAVPPSAPAGPPVMAVEPPTVFPLIPPKVLGGLPYASNYMKLAKTIHQTELVPKAFKGRPDAIMAAMMYGYELGLGPMQALNGLHVIEGKVGQDAELMRALITEAGHLFVLQSGADENGEPWATVYCRRKDWPEDIPTAEFSWTFQGGREAGLVEWFEKWTKNEQGRSRKLTWNPHGTEARPAWLEGSGVEHKLASSWANYGEDMCIARATARAARANFADVLKGMSYTPEELAEFDGGSAGDAPQEVPPSPPQPSGPAAGQSASQETEPTDQTAPAPDSASATRSEPSSPEGTSPDTIPPAAGSADSGAPAKASGPAKKAAKKAPAAKKAAPIHTENAASLPGATEGSAPSTSSTESATAPPEPPGPATQPDLAGGTADPEPAPPEPGAVGVTRELAKSLGTLLDALPEANRRLCQAFLVAHFPGKKAVDLTDDELTLAVNIAGGWPASADKYPIPPAPGEIAWEGFSASVVKVGDEYEGRCQLCEWILPESPTTANLPDFRRRELMTGAAHSHETGTYEDGTPFCPGREVAVQEPLGL